MHIIADTARISPFADLEDSQRGSTLTIADGVMIDAFVKIKFVGGSADICIGANSYINSGVVMYSGNGITIGSHVLIAANCTIAPVNHEYRARERTILDQRFAPSKGGIIIEDDVWIGANSVILDGARIRRGAVIGAQSLVRGEVESYGIYGGNPLTKLGMRT